MIKRYLVSWNVCPLQGFEDTGCILTIRIVYLWGLFEKIVDMPYHIPSHHNHKKYFDKWDLMVKNKTAF